MLEKPEERCNPITILFYERYTTIVIFHKIFFKFGNRRTKYLDQYLKREGVRDIKLHLNVKFGMHSFSNDHRLLYCTCLLVT